MSQSIPADLPITADRLVADIATHWPATVAVFQRHQIEFCCGGNVPLRVACEQQGLDERTILEELQQAAHPDADQQDWRRASIASLVSHIQARYHVPLRDELPRLHAMLQRVVERHGAQHGARLTMLLEVYETLQHELLDHIQHEDTVLFPLLSSLDDDTRPGQASATALSAPLRELVHEHHAAGAMLARIRTLTDDYVPPAGACPTFRGLYHGLAQLESDMHVHVHLENHVLFSRVGAMAAG